MCAVGTPRISISMENAMDIFSTQQTTGSNEHAMLRKNLAALAEKSPKAAAMIEQAVVPVGLSFVDTDDGVPGAELDGVALASKRRPMKDAERLAEQFDPTKSACAAVVGFGLGYHCGTMLQRLGNCGVVLCFEPDLGLLRGVLERIDYSLMFATNRFFLLTDGDDSVALTQMFKGIEAVVGLGVEIVNHPPSSGRIGKAADQFGRVLGEGVSSTRTHVVTALANSQISFRNSLMNLDYYTSCAGVGSLKDSCKGKPAVVVAAGPSLERNLEQLGEPGVRDSVVIIAVQTVLKTMLARGIKPHFVAALDYHELSKRFYEGLTASDVEGVRLVVEPQANPAILDAFPGEVLCVEDKTLDLILGDDLRHDMGHVELGGTVAHLCYSFARYLGCDPVIFIGQDLGFTDGQYYAAGAAIHQVWSGEINAHQTIEMLEWERIVRMKSLLVEKTDVHGRSIYSDAQMSTYLAQFESMFHRDVGQGLLVVDATEGGVRKLHTQVMTLKDAIESFGTQGEVSVPETIGLCRDDQQYRELVRVRLNVLIQDCERIAALSNQSVQLLQKMIAMQKDQKKLNKLIYKVQDLGKQVTDLKTAYSLTEIVNQIGTFNRMKQDRVIGLNHDADPFTRQRLQIERDIKNIQWASDAAKSVALQLIAGRDAMLGIGSKQTSGLVELQQDQAIASQSVDIQEQKQNRVPVHAMIMADPEIGGLGTPRDLGAKVSGSTSVIGMTIERVNQTSELDGITIVTPNPEAIERLIATVPSRLKIQVVGVDPQKFGKRTRRVGSARMQSSECWRGSVGMLSVYDEQLDVELLSQAISECQIEACAIMGADWAMIDPGLIDETVARFRCQDSEKRIAFSQAVPGLGTMVVDRTTIHSLAESNKSAPNGSNHFATIGGLVGYIPVVPQADPIAKGVCVGIDPEMRDAGVRVIADSDARLSAMCKAFESIKNDSEREELDGVCCVQAFGLEIKREDRRCPRTIVLETCTGRLASGDWGVWKRNAIEPVERAVLSMNDAHALFRDAHKLRSDVAVVFDGVGDPLMHPGAIDFVQLAKEDGISSVELRTDMLREGVGAQELLDAGIDILSVDVLAENKEAYSALTGVDRLDDVYSRIQGIFDVLRGDRSATTWFVPRMTKCDAVYEEVEQFYSKWLMICGSAIIDAIPGRVSGQRIQRLPIPEVRQEQLDRSTMYVQCDGTVVDRLGQSIRGINVFEDGVEVAYQKMCSALRNSQIEPKSVSNEFAA